MVIFHRGEEFESISKFSIGNRFHVIQYYASSVLQPASNPYRWKAERRFMSFIRAGVTCRLLTWNRLPIENFLIDSNSSPVWRLVTWIQICASLNHWKKMNTEFIRVIPRKLTANLELLIVLKILFNENRWRTNSFCSTRTCDKFSYTRALISLSSLPSELSHRKIFALHLILHRVNGILFQCWIKPRSFS